MAQQTQRLFDTGIESLLRNSQQVGATIHTNDLQPVLDFWARCEDRWRKGSGYRDDVLDIHKEWFQANRAEMDTKFQGIVDREWERILNRLSDILMFE